MVNDPSETEFDVFPCQQIFQSWVARRTPAARNRFCFTALRARNERKKIAIANRVRSKK